MAAIVALNCDNCSNKEILFEDVNPVIADILNSNNHSLCSVRVDGQEMSICFDCARELDLTDVEIEYL